MNTLSINCNNQTFVLHPSGAAYWENKEMLLIADVHLGKVTHFRKHGSAVPLASILGNFDQLTAVAAYFEPKTISFLGDLFHSTINNEWRLFSDWINQLECEVVLISGNHDIISNSAYDAINVLIKDEWVIDGFLLTHFPQTKDGLFNFAGHIHPGVRLRGFGKQLLKVSCFYKNSHQMIFPAFGNFTGKFIIEPKLNDQIFVNTNDEVIEIEIARKIIT